MNKYMKRRKTIRRRLTLVITSLFMIAAVLVLNGFARTSVKAETDTHNVTYKYYKSVEIKSGDTLWSIAKQYKTDDCTTQEYISEVKELNGLTSDNIQDNKCLMIVYYDTELK